MSQDWIPDLYTVGKIGDTTLSDMELMFATLRSSFSGPSSPPNPVDGNLWYDTDTDLLKAYRNSAWAGVLAGTASFKKYVYLNAAEDGWTVDGALADLVIAVKGGSQAYNVSGGTTAGTWTQPSHTLTAAQIPQHRHSISADGGHAHNLYRYIGSTDAAGYVDQGAGSGLGQGSGWLVAVANHYHGSWTGYIGSTNSHQHGTAYRPAAAVGTVQYPDMT